MDSLSLRLRLLAMMDSAEAERRRMTAAHGSQHGDCVGYLLLRNHMRDLLKDITPSVPMEGRS